MQPFTDRNSFGLLLNNFILARTNSLLYLFLSFLIHRVLRTFDDLWFNFICSWFGYIITFFLVYSLTNCNPFSFLLSNFVFSRANCRYNFLFSSSLDWILWTLNDFWLNFIHSWVWIIISFPFMKLLTDSHSSTFLFSHFIFTWSDGLFNLLFSLLTDAVCWSFNKFGFDFIRSWLRNIIWISFLYFGANSYTFSSVFRSFILAWTNCQLYLFHSLLSNRVIWTFDYMRFYFISTRLRDIVLFFFIYPLTDCYSFTFFFLNIIITRACSLLNFLLSSFIERIRGTFYNFWLYLIGSRIWHIILFSFLNFLSYCHSFSSIIFYFIFARPNRIFDFLVSFFLDWVWRTLNNLALNFISPRVRNIIFLFFMQPLSNRHSFSFVFLQFILTRTNSRFNLRFSFF